jgi:hypothetical protein
VRGWTTTNTGILAMAALPQGRLLAVGEFEGPADFGGPSLVTGNGLDAFVARYDARGGLLSFARYGDGKSQWADSVATNAAGEAVLVANGYGTADFGTGALAPPWLVSLDSEGRVRWARNFPAPLGGSLLSLDDQGTATITSIMNGPINLGDGSIGVTSSGGPPYPQFFLASFDARGTLRWSKGYIGGGVSGLAALSNGDIAVTAARWSTGVGTAPPPFDLGCGPIDTTVYVARLGSDGSCRWARTLSGAQQPLLAVTGGDLVVAGRAYAAPQDPELGLLPGSGSLFVERISATGTALWGRVFGQVSAGNVVGLYRLAASSSGIWLTGSFTDTLDLGSGTMAATSPNSAGFLARLAP